MRFKVQQTRVGKTSVQYETRVYSDVIDTGEEEMVFSTHVTFVRVDEQGEKLALVENE